MPGESENQLGDNRLFAMYVGFVTKRNDPDRLGRVKFQVPGLIEPESGWAWPLGGAGGGGKRLGAKRVPPIGAEVAVFFNAGDPDAPWYIAGQWGLLDVDGDDVTEIPGGNIDPDDYDAPEGARRELDAESAPDVHTDETRDFITTIDEREGKERFEIRHKLTGDVVEYDYPSGGGWTIKGTTAVRIVSDGLVSIEGNSIQINGRKVANSPENI